MAKDRENYDYDPATSRALLRSGISAQPVPPSKVAPRELPYSAAGLPGLMIRELPEFQGSNVSGFVTSDPRIAEEMRNRGMQQNVFVSPKPALSTIGHELEHLLARQNLGSPVLVREEFYDLLGRNHREKSANVRSFLTGLEQSLPYIKEKYGVSNAYLTPEFIKEQGSVGLYELLATLGGIESSKNVDLTTDPELRKTLFSSPAVRQAYGAVTGLRQTRLDPRDIPPYTKIADYPADKKDTAQEPGVINKLKRLLGYASGGHVPDAGNQKLI